ncbi:MAG: hypothetical protein Q8P12_02650 [bacterium]|nr:hypothetical protein [bacterium]MDZ4345149.1 hypothetical protein [Candidatus Binatia bacterium]
MNFSISVFMIAIPLYLLGKEAHIMGLISFACGMMLMTGICSLINEFRKL